MTEKEICLPFRSIWSPFTILRICDLPKELVLEILLYLEESEIFHRIYFVSPLLYEICQTDYLWKSLTTRKFQNLKYLYRTERELNHIYESKNRSWKRVYFHLLFRSFSLIKIVSGSYACLASETTTVWIAIHRKLCYFHGIVSTVHGEDISFPKDSRNFDLLHWMQSPQSGSCVVPVNRVFRLVNAIMSDQVSENEMKIDQVWNFLRSSNPSDLRNFIPIEKEDQKLVLKYFRDRRYRYDYSHGGFLSHPCSVTLYTRKDLKFFEKKIHGNKGFAGYIPWHFQTRNEREDEDRICFQHMKDMENSTSFNFEISEALLDIFPGNMTNYALLKGSNFWNRHFRYFKSYQKRRIVDLIDEVD